MDASLPGALTHQTPYPIPLQWLAYVDSPATLDVLEVLLVHSYDGEVIFDEAEATWHQEDDPVRQLRKVFARQTFSQRRSRLLALGLLHPTPRQHLYPRQARQVRRQLTQGLAYTWREWTRTATAIHRPRPYLAWRWPAWLGGADLGSRMALLGLLAPTLSARLCDAVAAPAEVRRSRGDIQRFVNTYFAHLGDADYLRTKTNKGLAELEVLGIVHAEAEDFFVLRLADLEQRPRWPAMLVARACRLEKPGDAPLAALVRDAMDACCEPAPSLRHVANRVRQLHRTHLFTEQERQALRKRFRVASRPGRIVHFTEAVEEHLRAIDVHAARKVSGEFRLPIQPIALAVQTVDGEPLSMPVKSVHRVNATQLLILPVFQHDISVEEVCERLAAIEVLIWQRKADGTVEVVPLPTAAPKRLGIEYGYVVRANDLHTRLDYARPFEVIVKCDRAEPRIHLECVFRILMSK
ncbi:MAG TPA: hypothetical protein DCL15_13575 [Chloroflexi bacterium]|nr:hypothetical protein [Chloroflexota bacterium]